MRASRLLSLLMLLQSRGRVSAQALAQALEVSVRTIHRDVDELSAAGVPVWADRGRLGGFQLQPGWRTRVDGLTAPEAQAMFLGGLPGPAAELGLGEAMASAQLKLLAALPEGWRADARRVSERFHLDVFDWFRGPSATDHLPAIAQAVWGERRIAMRYESWKGESARRVDPLGLVLKAGIWYLAAQGGTGIRTYRLSKILALELTDETFERPADFELTAWWRASTQRFEKGMAADIAHLRVSAAGLKALGDFGGAMGQAALASASAPETDGWCRVAVPFESIAHATTQVLHLGVEAEVLRPAGLRRAVVERVSAVAALYRE
jgi:predicted DNA-binding transcriptional regulator YafY